MKLENGKTYLVNHSRKGSFSMLIESQDDTWANGIITDGKANAMLDYNEKLKGEKITVRISFLRSAVEQPATAETQA
jgi:hypothetical protein